MSEDEQNTPLYDAVTPPPSPVEPEAWEEPELEEHPVMVAVKDHLWTVINKALENVPAGIEADFDAVLSHIKSQI
jgi:hypothetical protein